ncbi:hypothetical protein AAFN86_01060 [Roseomonas sp. CAU 1739]|uniref:hypothetical protein n=1 Tax=Roseomonas sp. CAU 1739 TaxID=3140364 RepID=UPI00325C1FAF
MIRTTIRIDWTHPDLPDPGCDAMPLSARLAAAMQPCIIDGGWHWTNPRRGAVSRRPVARLVHAAFACAHATCSSQLF